MITKALKNLKGQSESTGEAWRVVGDKIIKGSAGSVTYTEQDIVELPLDMLTDEEPTIEQVREILKGKVLASELTAEEVDAIADLYASWQVGLLVEVDEMYSHNSTLYKVIQPHTTQADWEPQNTPALWVVAYPDDVIPEWEQKAGAHDAYNTGDKVSFEGAVYESTYDGNTYSPTQYPQGWNWLYDI